MMCRHRSLLSSICSSQPFHFGAAAGMGLIHLHMRQDERALAAFERALAIHPVRAAAARVHLLGTSLSRVLSPLASCISTRKRSPLPVGAHCVRASKLSGVACKRANASQAFSKTPACDGTSLFS